MMKRIMALTIALLMVSLPGWAEPQKILEMDVKGMTCPFCAYGIEKNLSKLPGVIKAQVSLDAKKARVVMESEKTPDEAKIREVIVKSGFTPGKAIVHQEEQK